jgi:LytS/YehU family sensor histidine kinase
VQLAESALTRAKLDALRMQINPHFLFNCLNSIATLIHTDSHAADAMLGDLSTLLRAALASSNTPQTSLRQELEFLDRYLGIERRRFGSRLQFERVVSAECLEASVPTFILQPLAENAVKHGVETHAGSGLIRIGAKRVGDFLHIEVGNSGAGRVHDREHTNRQGIGIANTRARLEQTYGPQQHLSIENNLGGEFVVTMRIPFQTQPAA